MFEEITVRNFRTHRATTVVLGPVTLVIGNNNSGKSNLLTAIQHFSRLIARGRPDEGHATDEGTRQPAFKRTLKHVRAEDYFPHRHRLAPWNEPMVFGCRWSSQSLGRVHYTMELHPRDGSTRQVICREWIRLSTPDGREQEHTFGWDSPTDRPGLNAELAKSDDLDKREKDLCRFFFRDAASCFTYHFQPSYLKGKRGAAESLQQEPEGHLSLAEGTPLGDGTAQDRLVIHSDLGYEGGGLHRILAVLESRDRRAYDRLIASLRRFEPTFHGILVERQPDRPERVMWQFDLRREGAARVDAFLPDVVSDGLLRAACVSLLTSMRYPPALIQMEELENGLNPGNIESIINLIWQAAGTRDAAARGYNTQFILTTHSPSVLRQFSEHLNYVYNVRLDKRQYVSDVRNLNQSLEALVGLGGTPGEIDPDTRLVRLLPHQLTELWYSGTFG